MSFDLKARNKKIKDIEMGFISWGFFLKETGMGYVLGYGSAMLPWEYVYNKGNHGSPNSNDGYIVSSFEAKAMAAVGRGFCSVQRFVNNQWEELEEEDRLMKKENKTNLYRGTWHEDRLKQLEEFCDFAEKSSGFRIW